MFVAADSHPCSAQSHSSTNDLSGDLAMKTSAIPLAFAVTAALALPAAADQDDLKDAKVHVQNAVEVVQQMKQDPGVARLLDTAHGVFIVPEYGEGALVVGAHGGAGVLVAKHNGAWTGPAFYDMGGITVGAQVGGAGGAVAMILTSERAVEEFKDGENNFSLDANADLVMVNYSADVQASAGKGDVVLWSDTEGAFVGASLGVSNINSDEDQNDAFYGRDITARQILTGGTANPQAQPLLNALK
jgi:lipid-binding SYLF domain-containing protein